MTNVPFELQRGESIETVKLANHFKGIEAVGGKLYLTNQRLVFKSHSLNVQTHTEGWNYADIAEIKFFNSLFIVPNGLRIILRDGSREGFVVWRRKKLRRMIEDKMGRR